MVGSATAPAELLNEARCVSLQDEVTTRTHPTVLSIAGIFESFVDYSNGFLISEDG